MDDDEVRLLRDRVAALQKRLRAEAPTVDGLSRPALQVLSVAVRRPGVTPRETADDLVMTSSNVASALRELDAAGFVERRPDPADGRRVRLRATEPGRAAVAEVLDERGTWLGRAVAACLDDDEQRRLVEAGELMARLTEFEATGATR